MSDYEARLEEAREIDAAAAADRRARRVNAGLRRRAGAMDSPQQNVCVVCTRDIDFCKCEEGE